MEHQKRRSRMTRTRSDIRLELTPRDIEIFKLLERYRYLSSTFIHAFVGGASETRLKERLGNLFHQGYIDRPDQQWQMANCRHRPAIYEAGQGGGQVLRQNGIAAEPFTLLGHTAHRQFAHSLMICETMACIDLGVREDAKLRLISWQEILSKAPEATRRNARPFQIPVSISHSAGGSLQETDRGIVPDGIFGLEYAHGEEKTYRFFALEVDRGTMPVRRTGLSQSSYHRKILGYSEIIARRIHQSHLGLPNLFPLTITTGQRHSEQIMRLVSEETVGRGHFLFKAAPSLGSMVPSSAMLKDPWQRPNMSVLRIDQ